MTELRADEGGHWLAVETPDTLDPLFISKGSVAVDGISLTLASVAPRRIGLQIIPFTFAHTALAETHVGDARALAPPNWHRHCEARGRCGFASST